MTYITKDSGKRIKYDSGFNRDVADGKPRYDLIPGELLKRLAELYTRGAVKYGGEIEIEVWKPCPGLDGIEVSNFGKVKNTEKNKTYAAWYNKWGYALVSLTNQKNRHYQIHRLVMSAFAGPSTLEVNHKDGNKANNYIGNLEYVTRSQNSLHAHKTGLAVGPQKGKIEFEDAEEIRRRVNAGEKQKDVALCYGISNQTVCDIMKRRTWDKKIVKETRNNDNNWRMASTQEEIDRFKQSAWRHFMDWQNDWNTEEDHAIATIWNIIAYEWHTKHK